MITAQLIWLKTTTHYPVPPVCSAFWTPEDWTKTQIRTIEPLVIWTCGHLWAAIGERNADGAMLYRSVEEMTC